MINKSELSEELLKEIAATGGSYGRNLELSLCELARLRKALIYLRGRILREGKIPLFSMKLTIRLRRRFYRVRERAYEQRRYLIIYREALGLTKHREVFEHYNIEDYEL